MSLASAYPFKSKGAAAFGGRGAPIGTIGADGTFTLSTFSSGDGAMPGEYRVTVESFDEEVSMEEAYEGKKQTSPIPAKYANIKTTELKATIPDQTEPYQLKLELED